MKRSLPAFLTQPVGVLEREHFEAFPDATNRLAAWSLVAVLRGQRLADLGGVIVYRERGVEALLATREYIRAHVTDQLEPSTELEVFVTNDDQSDWRSAPLSTLKQVVQNIQSEVSNAR